MSNFYKLLHEIEKEREFVGNTDMALLIPFRFYETVKEALTLANGLQWRPIEEAPDDKLILASNNGRGLELVRKSTKQDQDNGYSFMLHNVNKVCVDGTFTHFISLSSLPKMEG